MRKRSIARRRAALATILALSAGAARGLELPDPFGLFGGGDGGGQKSDAPVRTIPGAAVDCPEILTEGASLRVPAGADNTAVRYQFSLGQMARECAVEGERLLIRVGVEGAIVLGPSGQPGSYSGALKISIRRQKDEEIVESRTFHVAAAVPAGGTRGDFRVITEPPLAVPYASAQAADDYEILVGFEGGASEKSASAQRRRKR